MYVCQQLDKANNTCLVWVEYTSILDTLAISTNQAYQLAGAMIGLMLLGWVGGIIGRILIKS